jgi:hypothetical protein
MYKLQNLDQRLAGVKEQQMIGELLARGEFP